MRSLAVETLSVRGFRNLASIDVELGPRFNVIAGDNGQGKTNLLESVYLVATSRSFRTAKLSELLAADGETASIRAFVREDGEPREQTVGLRAGVRAVRVDGRRPPTLAEYAVRTPVVVFHPGVIALSAGSGAERRKLLDRLALYLSPVSLADADAYSKATRARQRVLELRGDRAADLDEWEELMVRHGSAVSDARENAAAGLLPATMRAFARIGAPELALRTRYRRNAPADAEVFRTTLAQSRTRDRARGSASVGPHRDDLSLELDGRPLRHVGSQGQHRAVTLALELAEVEVITEVRGVHPLLLLDDVSSELDRARTEALFEVLKERRGQVIVTTTRPELVDTSHSFAPEDRRIFMVVGGRIAPMM